jgi:hypothetical protein
VRCQGSGDGVGFPDIHLGAAGAQFAYTCVLIIRRRLPALGVRLR